MQRSMSYKYQNTTFSVTLSLNPSEISDNLNNCDRYKTIRQLTSDIVQKHPSFNLFKNSDKTISIYDNVDAFICKKLGYFENNLQKVKYHISNNLKRHQLELIHTHKMLSFYPIFKTDV